MMKYLLFILLLQNILIVSVFSENWSTNKLDQFYASLQTLPAKYCDDKTKMLPACTQCIPGLEKSKGSNTCDKYIPNSLAIREEIKKLVVDRFGGNIAANRIFGLYPYLEKQEFMFRHQYFGELLSKKPITTLIDIGAYYNPIHLFITNMIQCISTVIIIEPILDALSVYLPCSQDTTKFTHYLFLPITFQYYTTIKDQLPKPETVVCIGCDSHYGPNRRMLETSFPRPYSLFLEYPSDYVHNAPYRKMNGDGPGEYLRDLHKYVVKTNETVYTKRVMKVIEYSAI